MMNKLIRFLVFTIMLAGLYPSSVRASPGVLDHVEVSSIINGMPSTIGFVMVGSTLQFTAQGFDDQNVPITGLTFTWNILYGGGTISSTGLFTAGSTPGTFSGTVQARAVQGDITKSGMTTVVVAPYPPYVYWAENPEGQDQNQQGTDNHVSWRWLLGAPLLWWNVSAPLSDVSDAIDKWKDNNAIPFLTYQQATSPETASIRLYRSFDPCGPGYENALGCNVAVDTYLDPDRYAAYAYANVIAINSRLVPSSGVSNLSVLVHELGHQYGLDERYAVGKLYVGQILFAKGAVCNKFERSVMNLVSASNPDCPLLEAPTELDKQRVIAFWSGGDQNRQLIGELRGEQLISGNGVGSWGIYEWQDMAWSELNQRLRFYYWSGTQWVQYQKPLGTLYEIDRMAYAGTHLYTEPRTIEWQINIMDYPNVPTGTTYNRSCIWAWFQAYGAIYGGNKGWGNDKCSNEVTLTH